MQALLLKIKAVKPFTFKQIMWGIIVLKAAMAGYFLLQLFLEAGRGTLTFDHTFFLFLLAGFVAQLIDGALGMAYGVSCTSLLLHFGLPAKMASASVHTAEIFTTGVSGLSHLKFNNIDRKLFFRIVLGGVPGAVLGAALLAGVLDGKVIRPYISAYLLILGVYLLYKGLRKAEPQPKKVRGAGLLAFAGGLLDAIGGGGWGPLVTSNLIHRGQAPREAIGTVNTAEFFVTYFASAVFIFYLGVEHWQIILGLIGGGVLAAPFGAFLAARMPKRLLLCMVSLLIILSSLYTILASL